MWKAQLNSEEKSQKLSPMLQATMLRRHSVTKPCSTTSAATQPKPTPLVAKTLPSVSDTSESYPLPDGQGTVPRRFYGHVLSQFHAWDPKTVPYPNTKSSRLPVNSSTLKILQCNHGHTTEIAEWEASGRFEAPTGSFAAPVAGGGNTSGVNVQGEASTWKLQLSTSALKVKHQDTVALSVQAADSSALVLDASGEVRFGQHLLASAPQQGSASGVVTFLVTFRGILGLIHWSDGAAAWAGSLMPVEGHSELPEAACHELSEAMGSEVPVPILSNAFTSPGSCIRYKTFAFQQGATSGHYFISFDQGSLTAFHQGTQQDTTTGGSAARRLWNPIFQSVTLSGDQAASALLEINGRGGLKIVARDPRQGFLVTVDRVVESGMLSHIAPPNTSGSGHFAPAPQETYQLVLNSNPDKRSMHEFSFVSHQGAQVARDFCKVQSPALVDNYRADAGTGTVPIVTVVACQGSGGGTAGPCEIYRALAEIAQDTASDACTIEVVRPEVHKLHSTKLLGAYTGAARVLLDLERLGMIPTTSSPGAAGSKSRRRFIFIGWSMGGGVIPQVSQELFQRCGNQSVLATIFFAGQSQGASPVRTFPSNVSVYSAHGDADLALSWKTVGQKVQTWAKENPRRRVEALVLKGIGHDLGWSDPVGLRWCWEQMWQKVVLEWIGGEVQKATGIALNLPQRHTYL